MLQLWNVTATAGAAVSGRRRVLPSFPPLAGVRPNPTTSAFWACPGAAWWPCQTVGVNLDAPLEYRLFVDGFAEMVQRLEPLVVLSYGRLPAACHEQAEVVTYPTRAGRISGRRGGQAQIRRD